MTRATFERLAGVPKAWRHRSAARARTDFPVTIWQGGRATHCRCMELSATGAIVAWHADQDTGPALLRVELMLPERHRSITALSRRVWLRGEAQALRFVSMADADRLSLAEHVDLAQLRGALVG